MLGKGLESLIPPQSNNSGQALNQGKRDDKQTPQQISPAQQNPQQQNQAQQQIENKPHILSTEQTSENNSYQPQQYAQPQQHTIQSQQPTTNTLSGPTSQNYEKAQAQIAHEKKSRKPESIGSVFHIEVDKIKPNPQQPRRQFDEEALKELASSIREFGLLQPITVSKIDIETPLGTDVEYQLIAGERRWLASKMLGLERIPAIIRNVDLELERLELAIIENIQRENLNPIERARAFARLQDEFHLTQREIAARMGKSRESIANSVRLLDLPAAIMEAIEKNQINESHGRLLLTINDPAVQNRIFHELLEKKMTTRDLQNKVRGTKIESKKETDEEASPEIKMMQERLSADLGAPVKIESQGERGQITITFFSPEELRNIMDKLGGEENQTSL